MIIHALSDRHIVTMVRSYRRESTGLAIWHALRMTFTFTHVSVCPPEMTDLQFYLAIYSPPTQADVCFKLSKLHTQVFKFLKHER